MWARRHARHVGTRERKHARHVGTWTRKHARHVGTRSRKHVRHVETWARKAHNLADSENLDSKIFKAKKDTIIMQSKFGVCRIEKSRFMKKRQKDYFSNFGIKTLLNKIPLLGDILFWVCKNE